MSIAEDTWAHIEYLLINECGLRVDEGLQSQRVNCINAIKNATFVAPSAAIVSAAIEFLSRGEGLHRIRVDGKMMDRKRVARALTTSYASPATIGRTRELAVEAFTAAYQKRMPFHSGDERQAAIEAGIDAILALSAPSEPTVVSRPDRHPLATKNEEQAAAGKCSDRANDGVRS